jgi:hypothetical protein
MQCSREAAARLLAIDELQDDLLRRLDELERRTESVLADCLAAAPAASSQNAPQAASKSHPRVRPAA